VKTEESSRLVIKHSEELDELTKPCKSLNKHS